MPKRGENIYKRKDGRWEGRYIRGRSPSGRAEYGYVYAGSYRECRAKRQKCLDACREAPVAASSLTLNQAAERFLADKQDDLKRSTLARYTYVLKHYILPVFGAVLLSQLTANQISEFLRRLQKNGLSGKSARDVGVLLKSILRYSAKKLDCPSPGMTVELPAYRRKQIDIFYPDEIQRLAQMIMDEPTTTGIGILLTLNTGLRLGELCALQYKDIDLRNGVVHVRKTVQRIRSGDRTSLMVLPPKSNSARRTIPLPGDMAALLQKLVQSHPNGENYLLTGKNVPMEPRTMQYQYRALLKAAGIPYRNFHTLRHAYASRCVERGIDVKSLSEMLGHADVRTTLQVYVHSSLEHKMRVIQSICFLAPALAAEFAPSPSPSIFRKHSNINSFWQRYRKWGKFTKSTDAFLFREFTTNSLYYLAHYRQFVCCVAFQKNGATRWGDTIFFVTGTEHHIPESRNVLWDSGSPGRGFRNCPLRCR